MTRGFEYYHAFASSATKDQDVDPKRLEMPVLASGGQRRAGMTVKLTLEKIVPQAQGGMLADCGHYVAEEQPAALAHRLLEFCRDVEWQVALCCWC